MHNHKRLRVYEDALDAAVAVYEYAKCLPDEERFNLTDQTRRSAVSIPSNIAEGCGRSTDKDTARFLSNAIGSAYELETQLLIAQRLGYADPGPLIPRLVALQRQIVCFRRRLL